jgi:cation-transporting ATPase E
MTSTPATPPLGERPAAPAPGTQEAVSPQIGLSSDQVAARVAAGQVNGPSTTSGRSVAQILRANVATRFNAILGTLLVVVLIVGPFKDAVFGVVLVVNTVFGVVQEVRSKRTLDRLAVLTAPSAHALRDGRRVELPVEQVVIDDMLELRPGDQVVADGMVEIDGGLEVDESLLTGESLAVDKHRADPVLSGSVVVAGNATMRVTQVGGDAFARRLQGDARRFSLVHSDLQQGINRILRLVTWVMVPVGILLIVSQMVQANQPLDVALRGSVAGVGAMVPQGLVLLTTMAFTLGAVRLARRRVLVQELAAIEGLARVDVVCVDKTGTLTEPGIDLVELVELDHAPASQALGAMAASDPNPNATMQAAARTLPSPVGWDVRQVVPFSSARKWSAVEFDEQGSWVIGAPEIVAPELPPAERETISQHTSIGRRVLLLARSSAPLDGETLPSGITPSALVVFEEGLRPDAESTIGYLLAQGITVKVLSGDSPETVGAVAARVGIPGAEHPLDARSLPDGQEELAEVMERTSVLGRVQPHQKRDIVTALQARGHVVAMTGDGVNDIPALKAADLGMAMGSGSPATRAVGRLVLLDSSFAAVPQILGEGRRVIANVERVANLFVTKTAYAVLLALVVGIVAVPYPFFPRHLTVVDGLTIGIPGFFLAFAPGEPRARSGFVRRVLSFALPAGAVLGSATLAAYLLARDSFGATNLQAQTVATLTLLALGIVVLGLVARPLTAPRALLVAAMVVGGVLVWVVPFARHFFDLVPPPETAVLVALAIVVGAVPLLVLAIRVTASRRSDTAGSSP